MAKEQCVICGKEVGMMSRSKLADKTFICSDCKKLTHPFIRVDHLTSDQAKDVIEEMKADEETFKTTKWRKTSRSYMGKTWTFYDDYDQGIFALDFPETAKYPHCIFNMLYVRPYDRSLEFSVQNGGKLPNLTKSQVSSSIVLNEKTDASGTKSYELSMPYFRYNVDIKTVFPSQMKADDRDYVVNTMRSVIGSYQEHHQNTEQMQLQNMERTVSKALAAAISGKGEEEVQSIVQEGLETDQAIENGEVKRGLFGRLKRKK